MLRQHSDNNQYCLSIPKTTIGSRDCELVIQGPDVAPQHLVIEKRSGADYVLHDLGTSEGTFVNHCRVSGASVRLNCGDIIKLGPDSPAFTFITPGLLNKTTEIIVPAVIGDIRPGSAPIAKSELVDIPAQRNHSGSILSGRSTMKRNVINGILGGTSPEKGELLELLQQTVAAQESKLSSLAQDIKHFKSVEHKGANHAHTISQLEREIDTLKTGENVALHKLEKQRGETHSANHVLATLQTELMDKAERERTLLRELETLQKAKLDAQSAGTVRCPPVVTLRRQLAEREAELRHVRAEFNSFKVRPDELKEQNIIFAKENKNLRKQVRDSKRQSQENQDKVLHLEKDLGELQGKLAHETRMHITSRDMVARLQTDLAEKAKLERLLKIESKESEVQLKHFEASVREALSKLHEGGSAESDDSEDLTTKLGDLVKLHLETTKSLEKREEELALSRKGYGTLHENLAKLELESLSLLEIVQAGTSQMSEKVQKEGDKIAALDIADNLQWLQGMVLTLARSVQKYSYLLEKRARAAVGAAEATGLPSHMGVESIIENLKETTLRLTAERNSLKDKLTNTIDEYEGKLALQHKKYTAKSREETESLKRLHDEHMRALYTNEQQKQDVLVREYSSQIRELKEKTIELEEKIRRDKTTAGERSAKQSQLEDRIEELLNSEKTSKMMENSLRDKISQFDTETLAMRQATVQHRDSVDALENEAESLREQNRQYAVTIVSMENKLHSMSSRCNNMEHELTSSISKLEALPPPPPEPYEVLKGREHEMRRELQRLTTLSNTLRREYGLAKAEADQRAVQIQGLRCDLAGAAARLSDMSGELSEGQKIEMENLKDKLAQQNSQITVQRESIDVLTLKLEEAKKRLANVPDRLPKKSPQKVKIEYKDRDFTIEEADNIDKGKKCVDERHSIIIDKQRLALAEFREQLRSKAANAHEPVVEVSGSQQITRLRKELSELRAAIKHKDLDYTAKETDLKNKLNSNTEKNSDVVKHIKSSLNDSQRLLGHSEACFASLASEIRSTLNQPQSPIFQLTVEKLEHGLKERALLTADLGAQIIAITTRLSQKDIMLHGYQDDLSNIRKTDSEGEELLQKRVKSLQEESCQLRKSLSHLQGELDQQQRLNNALVQRHASREVNSEPSLQHHCPDPRTESQIELMKKQHQEEIKRKNYDIRKLKEELSIS